jgi:hypothetical protein
VLAELFLSGGDRPAALVEHDGARAGGALVESEDVLHSGKCLVKWPKTILAARPRLDPPGSIRVV